VRVSLSRQVELKNEILFVCLFLTNVTSISWNFLYQSWSCDDDYGSCSVIYRSLSMKVVKKGGRVENNLGEFLRSCEDSIRFDDNAAM